ncbi:MAG TPA: hypothetical protein VK934_13345, partial [Fimbriimonas sp.]|nr:hypothetical protein [Fimbriimonas sp.]
DEMFPGRLLPVGPYVDVAVCRGATRMHQAPPPILPVGFNLLVAGKHTELIRPGAAVGKVVRRRRQLNAPTEHAVEAVMECVLPDGDAVPFLSLKFRNGFNGEIAASISASTIRLSAEPASGSPTVYEVSLT